jgi:Heterokaryon incompatibility protein (HET)
MSDTVALPAADTKEHLCKALQGAFEKLWGRSPDREHVFAIRPSSFIVLQTDSLASSPECAACEQSRPLLPGGLDRYARIELMHYRMDSLLDPADIFLAPESEILSETHDYSRFTLIIMRTDGQHPEVCHKRLAPLRQQGFMWPKPVNSNTVNFGSVTEWLTTCSIAHQGLCLVKPRPELATINLIDSHNNTVLAYNDIETFEGQEIDYLCLSYVWGSRDQNIIREGNRLFRVPRTIEDAMRFTREIGKRYLWVDSVSVLNKQKDICTDAEG